MIAIIQFFGAIAAVCGALALAAAAFIFMGGQPANSAFWAVAGISSLLSGCMLFVFGKIASTLELIEGGQERLISEIKEQNRKR